MVEPKALFSKFFISFILAIVIYAQEAIIIFIRNFHDFTSYNSINLSYLKHLFNIVGIIYLNFVKFSNTSIHITYFLTSFIIYKHFTPFNFSTKFVVLYVNKLRMEIRSGKHEPR